MRAAQKSFHFQIRCEYQENPFPGEPSLGSELSDIVNNLDDHMRRTTVELVSVTSDRVTNAHFGLQR